MALFGKNKFDDIERDYSGGIAKYKRKKSDVEKRLQDQSNPDNAKAIASLKLQLQEEVDKQRAQRRTMFRQTDNRKANTPLAGREFKALSFDTKQTTNSIDRIIRELAKFGVKTTRDKAGYVTFKNMNEGGQPTMAYDVKRLKEMKLETFQESAAGTITKEATDYLIKYFDVMIEAAKTGADDVNTLVTDYVAACKDGDDDKKTELKEKITAATNCKKAKEELETLKEKLSDKEKEFVEELDAEICGNNKGDCDEGSKGSEGAEEGKGETPVAESGDGSESCGSADTKKALDDTTKAAGELGKKIEDGANKAGKDNKEAFDQLLSAASESAITDAGKEALLDYVTESVATGDMDADIAIQLTTLMSM